MDSSSQTNESDTNTLENSISMHGLPRTIFLQKDQLDLSAIDAGDIKIFGFGDSLGSKELLKYFSDCIGLEKLRNPSLKQKTLRSSCDINFGMINKLNLSFNTEVSKNSVPIEETYAIVKERFGEKADLEFVSKFFDNIISIHKLYNDGEFTEKMRIPMECIEKLNIWIRYIFDIIIAVERVEELYVIADNALIFEDIATSFCLPYVSIYHLFRFLTDDNYDITSALDEFVLNSVSALKDYLLRLSISFVLDINTNEMSIEETNSYLDNSYYQIRSMMKFKLAPEYMSETLSQLINNSNPEIVPSIHKSAEKMLSKEALEHCFECNSDGTPSKINSMMIFSILKALGLVESSE